MKKSFYKKFKIGLVYGGASCEHLVSKMTAKSILENIDQNKFDIIKIYVDKKGKFNKKLLNKIDIAFLAWHGPNCEDGKFQKFLENKKIKFTGAGSKSSKINMDKGIQKKYFQKAGLKITKYFIVNNKLSLKAIDKKIKNNFRYPVFIKPTNTGSSLGMSKVKNYKGLKKSINAAKKINNKIIIEKAILNPRELEVGVLGNKKLIISNPGEILTNGKIYSYENKYFKPFSTTIEPKNLSKSLISKVKKWAEIAYKSTFCKGYARVDFFLDQNGRLYINEINTLPGFTKISMYPKLMEATGIKYKDLITKIIKLGLK